MDDSRRCPGCGELSEIKSPFCTNCGSKLSADASGTLTKPDAELPSSKVASSSTQVREASKHSTSRETASSYDEPGEVYSADLHQESASTRSRERDRTDDLDNSETAEIHRDYDDHYPSASQEAADLATRYNNRNDQTPPQVTVAAPSATEPISAPTLSMMESYGRGFTPPSQFRWRHGAFLALIVLIFVAGVGIGAWYWWSNRNRNAQLSLESPTPNQRTISEEPSSSPSPKPVTNAEPAIRRGADEELKILRDRRMKAQPSDTTKIVAAIANAEKKYPNDYRFPYERAKLSITGITSHHEAFGALAIAAEKAIDNGKAQEMLGSLIADSGGDFYKLSRGHVEWRTLLEVLRNKDKGPLKALHH